MNGERGNMEKYDILEYDISLRPKTLKEYVGQDKIKEMLKIFIFSARKREESLDHVLFYGPPGLGKTTLAGIIAREMGANFQSLTAPSIDRIGDMVAILSNLEAGDILFIDEIHRLPRVIEEVLYSAMEDFVVDIIIGKDATSNTIRLDLPPFTLVGATTRFGDISAPLRDRFGIVHQLHYYEIEELTQIVKRTAKIYNFPIEEEAAREIAKRSRGTPRIANRLFRRVRDFAQYEDENCDCIRLPITSYSLLKLDIDEYGLNQTDHRYLRALVEMFNGGPVGLNALASAISEEITTLEDVYEPYLLQEGFILRTPRGRLATDKTYNHLGINRK
jgi:Holliday junction DNA helicase RuvB